MSKKKARKVGIQTMEDQLALGMHFDVELWKDIARYRVEELSEEDAETVEEAVASLLWYLGMASSGLHEEPNDDEYRRLRECCGNALRSRNIIREVFYRHDGHEIENWRGEGYPEPANDDGEDDERPPESVLH